MVTSEIFLLIFEFLELRIFVTDSTSEATSSPKFFFLHPLNRHHSLLLHHVKRPAAIVLGPVRSERQDITNLNCVNNIWFSTFTVLSIMIFFRKKICTSNQVYIFHLFLIYFFTSCIISSNSNNFFTYHTITYIQEKGEIPPFFYYL